MITAMSIRCVRLLFFLNRYHNSAANAGAKATVSQYSGELYVNMENSF